MTLVFLFVCASALLLCGLSWLWGNTTLLVKGLSLEMFSTSSLSGPLLCHSSRGLAGLHPHLVLQVPSSKVNKETGASLVFEGKTLPGHLLCLTLPIIFLPLGIYLFSVALFQSEVNLYESLCPK